MLVTRIYHNVHNYLSLESTTYYVCDTDDVARFYLFVLGPCLLLF